MKIVLKLLILTGFMLGFVSCLSTVPPKRDFAFPQTGDISESGIVDVKDFTPVSLVFVKSTETIDTLGTRTGSKITYEMLMREAARLNADDVINIRIDINQVEQRLRRPNGQEVLVTTFNYTASGLAIRYTTAQPSSMPAPSSNVLSLQQAAGVQQ